MMRMRDWPGCNFVMGTKVRYRVKMSAIDSSSARAVIPATQGDRIALNAFFPTWMSQRIGYSAWLVVEGGDEPEVVGAAILEDSLDGTGEDAGLVMDIGAIDDSTLAEVLDDLLEEVLGTVRACGAPAVKINSSSRGAKSSAMLLDRGFVVTETFDTYQVSLLPALEYLQNFLGRIRGKVRSRATWSLMPAIARDAEAIAESWRAWIGGSFERKYQQLRYRLNSEADQDEDVTTSVLALDGELLVGLVIAGIVDEETLVVHGQAVAPALRMDPLHAELLETVLVRARDRGATRIRFEAGRSQPNTLRVAARHQADVLSSVPSLRRVVDQA